MPTSDFLREDRNLNFYVEFPLPSQITYQLANRSYESPVWHPVPRVCTRPLLALCPRVPSGVTPS